MESFKAISSNVEPIKEDQDDVKPIEVKAPQNTSAIIFDTVEEFTRFFRANESLFKTPDGSYFLSANRLNRSYKVPGYRISIANRKKDNESLSLHKDYYRGAVPAGHNAASLVSDVAAHSLERAADEPRLKRASCVDDSVELADKLINPDIIDNLGKLSNIIDDILARLDHIEEFLSSMTEHAALAGDACSPGRACHPLGRAAQLALLRRGSLETSDAALCPTAEPGSVRRNRLNR